MEDFQAGKKYPIMITLHGAGEWGIDNAAQLVHDFNNMWAVDSIQKRTPVSWLRRNVPGTAKG